MLGLELATPHAAPTGARADAIHGARISQIG
jgi:hypothetical protein